MKILLIILDGCSINSFIKAQTPFLDSMGEKFFKTYNCTAVWPTATYTGHSSIVSGTFPERHGMIGNQFFDRSENLIKHFDDYYPSDYIQVPTLFELFDTLNTMAIAEPITKGAKNIFPMNKLNNLNLEERNEVIFKKTINNLRDYNIKFGVINFAGVDGYGEIYGPNNTKYLDEISRVDQFLSDIYESINEKSYFIITADHGMTEINRRFDLKKYFEKMGLSIRCLDSHRASHLYFNEKNDIVYESISKLKEIEKIFLKSETKKINLFHERTGDIVIFANKKIELEKENLNGSHGGLSNDELYVPLFIYSKDLNFKYPIQNDSRKFSILDIAPTIFKILKMQTKTDFQGKAII